MRYIEVSAGITKPTSSQGFIIKIFICTLLRGTESNKCHWAVPRKWRLSQTIMENLVWLIIHLIGLILIFNDKDVNLMCSWCVYCYVEERNIAMMRRGKTFLNCCPTSALATAGDLCFHEPVSLVCTGSGAHQRVLLWWPWCSHSTLMSPSTALLTWLSLLYSCHNVEDGDGEMCALVGVSVVTVASM